MKEWFPKWTVAQMLNALSSFWWGLSAAGISQGKRDREHVTQPFILPGKVIRAEWHKPSSLVENIKSKHQRPTIFPALDNNFENINHHVI